MKWVPISSNFDATFLSFPNNLLLLSAPGRELILDEDDMAPFSCGPVNFWFSFFTGIILVGLCCIWCLFKEVWSCCCPLIFNWYCKLSCWAWKWCFYLHFSRLWNEAEFSCFTFYCSKPTKLNCLNLALALFQIFNERKLWVGLNSAYFSLKYLSCIEFLHIEGSLLFKAWKMLWHLISIWQNNQF